MIYHIPDKKEMHHLDFPIKFSIKCEIANCHKIHMYLILI